MEWRSPSRAADQAPSEASRGVVDRLTAVVGVTRHVVTTRMHWRMTMSGPVDIYRQVAAKWSKLTDEIAPDQWDNPTPCTEWDVRRLVDHVNGWQTQGGNLLGMEIAAGAAWPDIVAAYEEKLADPSQLTGDVPEFGGVPKHNMAGFMIGDLLIHCWDLARAIGADETLPPAAVEATTMGLHHAP